MKTIRADEYCKFVTDGTHDSPKQVNKGRKLITSKHLGRYGIDFEGAKNISESDYQKVISRSKVEQWDILFSMIGTIGNLYLERNHKIEYACKNMGIFQLGGDESKAKWLYYYLQTPKAKEYIETSGRGTTQSYVPLAALRALPVDVVDGFTRDKILFFGSIAAILVLIGLSMFSARHEANADNAKDADTLVVSAVTSENGLQLNFAIDEKVSGDNLVIDGK